MSPHSPYCVLDAIWNPQPGRTSRHLLIRLIFGEFNEHLTQFGPRTRERHETRNVTGDVRMQYSVENREVTAGA